jgi:hypothetical protein
MEETHCSEGGLMPFYKYSFLLWAGCVRCGLLNVPGGGLGEETRRRGVARGGGPCPCPCSCVEAVALTSRWF